MDQQKITDNNLPEASAPAEENIETTGEITPVEAEPTVTNFDFADEEPVDAAAEAEHVPSEFEKKMDAIPEKKWQLYQKLIGGALGIGTAAALFLGGSGDNMGFLTCIILIFLGPRYFEKQCSRSINTFRKYLCIFLGIGVVLGAIYYFSVYGFTLSDPAPAA